MDEADKIIYFAPLVISLIVIQSPQMSLIS